jgi:hypothetical protein
MKRLGASFGSRKPREPHPPSLFELITLITYLFSLLPFACLACLCTGLCLRTLALTPYPTQCVGLSTYVIKSFVLFHSKLTVAPIIAFLSFQSIFSPKFFFTFPPWLLSPIFHLYYYYPFHLPDFLQPACFSACLLLLCFEPLPCGTTCVILSVCVGLKGLCGLQYTPREGKGRKISNHRPSASYTGRERTPCVLVWTFPSADTFIPPPCPWLLLTNPKALSAESYACVYHTRFGRC